MRKSRKCRVILRFSRSYDFLAEFPIFACKNPGVQHPRETFFFTKFPIFTCKNLSRNSVILLNVWTRNVYKKSRQSPPISHIKNIIHFKNTVE